MASEYKPIPVAVAKEIADKFGKSIVVILAFDREWERTHTTTYGVTSFEKENAAAVGEIATQAIGCDLGRKQVFEDFHRDYAPAFYKRAVEILRRVVGKHGRISLNDGPDLKDARELLAEIDQARDETTKNHQS